MRVIRFSLFLLCFLGFFSPTASSAQDAPASQQLKLSGPRIGMAFFTGNIATRIKDPKSIGGLNARPVMSQFGYQFETAYISNDKLQALFEFFPNITGLDQGKFLPNVSILHGLRLNNGGWEFIVGPIFYASKRTEGFFDPANGDQWTRLTDWRADNPNAPEPEGVIKMLDTRGDIGFTSSIVLAIGKNFRAGDINLPINVFVIPHAEGTRYGISFGFNKQH
ncbi:MAG: hypothetical protein J0L99_09315 [Chitinophagales bacterium]|nr:hypothetical protein [Chitinophagales bacterium]